jgi:hypothetical protein
MAIFVLKAGKIGAGLTFHGLRHTVATKLADAEADDKTIAAITGRQGMGTRWLWCGAVGGNVEQLPTLEAVYRAVQDLYVSYYMLAGHLRPPNPDVPRRQWDRQLDKDASNLEPANTT